MLVLEQLSHHVERLAFGHRQKIAADAAFRQQRLALLARQRFGEPLGQEDTGCDLFRLAVPVAESCGIFFRETRDIGERLLEIAPEHQRCPVEMRLTEFIARGDVAHALGKPQIAEPRRLADVEVIDRMQIVIEAGRRCLFGDERAAVLQTPVDEKNIQSAARQIRAEHEAMVSSADDDPVVIALQRTRHASPHYGEII